MDKMNEHYERCLTLVSGGSQDEQEVKFLTNFLGHLYGDHKKLRISRRKLKEAKNHNEGEMISRIDSLQSQLQTSQSALAESKDTLMTYANERNWVDVGDASSKNFLLGDSEGFEYARDTLASLDQLKGD